MIGGDPFVFIYSAIFLIPAVAIAIPAHELGHALAATLLGDPTARNRGFLKLQPRLFFEPYGLLAAFLLRAGWGAMAPVNEQRLAGAARKVGWALGGPAANLLLAVGLGLLSRYLIFGLGIPAAPSTLAQPPLSFLSTIVYAAYFLNLSTMAFNLLPIPGLDGWRVLEAIFRTRNPRFFYSAAVNRQQIWMVCFLIIFVGSFFAGNLLNVVMSPFYAPPAHAIFGLCTGYPGLSPCPPSAGF